MSKCIYKKTELQGADAEHILQNFLGAKWTSNEIVCNEVQSLFGRTIDLALEKGLREIRNLIGTKGGRGGSGQPLKNIQVPNGNKYHLEPGGIPKIAEPIVNIQPLGEEKYQIQVQLDNKKQLGWAIKKIQEKIPDLKIDIDDLKNHALHETSYINQMLPIDSSIGGDDYFRGLLKSIFNLLGVKYPEIALLPCLDEVRNFILCGDGNRSNYIRWLHTSSPLSISELGQFDHFICVYSNGNNIDGLAQFFGGITHLVRLTDKYEGHNFRIGYQVNPLRNTDPAETRDPFFEKESLPMFDDGHQDPNSNVWAIYGAIYDEILRKYQNLATSKEISRIVDRVLLPHDGENISDEMHAELVGEFLKFLNSRISSV